MQNKLLPIVLDNLSTTLGTQIKAKDLDIDFFEEISLNDIYINGANGDTLVFAKTLNVDFSLVSLWRNKIFIDDIRLDGGRIILNDENGEANYRHIIDHLENNKSISENDTSETAGWDFGLDDIILNDMYISLPSPTSTIQLDIPRLEADLASFPKDFESLVFNQITGQGLNFKLIEKTKSSNLNGKIEFPSLPINLTVSNLQFENASIKIEKEYIEGLDSRFDANHIDISNANMLTANLVWGNKISGNIKSLTLNEKSGLDIQKFNADVTITDNVLDLKNLKISTPDSKLDLSIRSEYSSFDDLINKFIKQSTIAQIKEVDVNKKDIVRFIDPKGFNQIDLNKINRIKYTGEFKLENSNVILDRTYLNIDDSLLLNGDFEINNTNSLAYSIRVKEIKTSQRYLSSIFPEFKIPTELKELPNIYGTITASGNDREIMVHDINLQSGDILSIIGKGSVSRLDNAPDIWVDFNFEDFKIKPNSLLNQDSIPPELFNLGNIDYVGAIKGNSKSISLDGDVITGIGDAVLDATIAFNSEYTNATYKGKFDFDEFDLGTLLQDSTFGIVTAMGSIEGNGLDFDDLNIEMDFKSENFEYTGEKYENIEINGTYTNGIFTGKVLSNDDKITLNFDGVVNLNEENSDIEFVSNIERLDLTQFGVGDSLFWMSGLVKAKMHGNNFDNFLGKGIIEDLKIGTQNGIFISDSILNFTAENSGGGSKIYQLKSSFVDVRAEGSIELSKLSVVLEEYFKNYIPIEFGYEATEAVDTILFENQNFDLDIKTKDINPILHVILGDKVKLRRANLSGSFSSSDSKINFKGSIDSLSYGDYILEKGNYFFDGRRDFINGNIILENISNGKDILVYESDINLNLNNQSSNIVIELFDNLENQTLLIGGDISRTSDYVLHFEDQIIINQSVWNFSPYNELTYGKDGLYMQDVSITKGKQAITAYTDDNENGQAIELLIDHFIVSELTSIIGKKNEYFEGKISGAAIVNNIWGKPFITADLSIDNIMLDDYVVGKLKVEAIQNTESNSVKTKMILKGPQNDAYLDLSYGISDRSINGFLDMKRLEVATLDPFLTDILSDSGGAIVGKLNINGTPTEPKIEGNLDLVGVQTTPVFTNSRYAILDQTIRIDNESISFGDMIIVDTKNNVANLTGQILHTNMSEMYLDLNINTDQFLFLNTSPLENPLFYGNVTVEAEVSILGPLDDIKIEGAAKAINNSKLAISPFSVDELDYENDLVIFADPRKISLDSLIAKSEINRNTFPFDVDLKLTVNEDSEFEMVMNPITGDNIKGQGNSNLVFNLKKSGEIELFGTYTVTKGEYLFTYGLITKEFEIEEGGRVIFNGDPLDGKLDVTAIYEANTTVHDLLIHELDGLDASEISDTKKKRKIDVVLNLANSISAPEIKMDIIYDPSDVVGDTDISELVTQKLRDLRTDPNELNNQVFGLLLFDNFISTSGANTDLTQTGTNFAINSLSGLVTNQLNKLANSFVKGVDLNFDVNSYSSDLLSSGNSGLVTELGVGISKQLFNERLTLSAGTNVDLESSSTEALFNNLAGDFVISYKLTENGKYNVKVFRKSNYDVILDENASKNGFSFNAKKEFGSIKKKKK